jgi:YHS domain-containing protein
MVIYILVLVSLFLALRHLWRLLLNWASGQQDASFERKKEKPIARELKRDPACGTYVSEEISLKSRIGGREYHFCSRDCQEEFLNARRTVPE